VEGTAYLHIFTGRKKPKFGTPNLTVKKGKGREKLWFRGERHLGGGGVDISHSTNKETYRDQGGGGYAIGRAPWEFRKKARPSAAKPKGVALASEGDGGKS